MKKMIKTTRSALQILKEGRYYKERRFAFGTAERRRIGAVFLGT